MLRKGIQKMLTYLVRTHKPMPSEGLYPPSVNLSESQTDRELLEQLQLFLNYLERPEYSHITRDKIKN